MAPPKLYLFLLDGSNVLEVKTLRDLEDAIHVWSEKENAVAGILHCAFMRPSLSLLEGIPRNLRGKVLYTSSMQGAMPELFPSMEAPSLQVELNDKEVDCYLAVNRWGYELDEYNISLESQGTQEESRFTTSQAVQEVLREYNNTPQTKTEIYERIVNSQYCQFNTSNPVQALDVTLNRETLGTNYSNTSFKPLFGKTDDNKYYLLEGDSHKLTGWLKQLSVDELVSLADICIAIIRKVDTGDTGFVENEASIMADTPLFNLVEDSLGKLTTKQKSIINGRLGFDGKVETLEELGELHGLTRERIRQIAKKTFNKIIDIEVWDDFLRSKIDSLFNGRKCPLQLETLDIEDEWFKGFSDNFLYLAQVIEEFSCGEYRVIENRSRHFIIRTDIKSWDKAQRELTKALKSRAHEKKWSRMEVRMHIASLANKYELGEFATFFEDLFSEYLKYDGEVEDSILVDYGKSAEQAVAAVLFQADEPMHFEKIAIEATRIYGREVDSRLAQNISARHDEVFLYDRGTFGLIKHCPLSAPSREEVYSAVEKLLYAGPINKQWHSNEILDHLTPQFTDIQEQLNPYVLRMCISSSPKINFLNRMIWARSDSGLKPGDRIETNRSFIQILEKAGEPLSGQELKKRLSQIRGVSDNMQIHGSDRLVAMGPNIWGLSEWCNE